MGTDTSYAAGMTSDQPRRRADAERNVEAILAATGDLLARGGVPSMSEVAAAAGVGRVTLYAHFSSREVLVEAVVRRGIVEADEALSALQLGDGPVEEALGRLVREAWPILDRHRKVRAAALALLGPEHLREQHDDAFRHVERLIDRGRKDGSFRSDLSRDWLVATFYAILHAAADEAEAGRLDPADAPEILITTLLATLRQ